jgi:hypothetical protein
MEQVIPIIETTSKAFLGDPIKLKSSSSETVARVMCEQNVILDLELIDKLNNSDMIGDSTDVPSLLPETISADIIPFEKNQVTTRSDDGEINVQVENTRTLGTIRLNGQSDSWKFSNVALMNSIFLSDSNIGNNNSNNNINHNNSMVNYNLRNSNNNNNNNNNIYGSQLYNLRNTNHNNDVFGGYNNNSIRFNNNSNNNNNIYGIAPYNNLRNTNSSNNS